MIFKQLPTAISDLNKLGIALKSLEAMKLGTVGVNLGNVEAYRTALKGLSVEQSVFALASKGATEEQIRQILVTDQAKLKDVEAAMAKAGLTTATKALNAEELIALATKKGISAERAKEIASALGLIATEKGQVVSKKQLTVATLQQVGATDAEITAILGLNAAEAANIGITNILTASFAKLWAVITAHPIGAILTAIGAVAVGAIAYINKTNKEAKKTLVEAHENAKQALEDTKTSLSDDKSELQSINSELEKTKDKIKEISSIGVPTSIEQNELNKLSTSNAQLEIQKTLLENNIKLKQKSAALDAKELLGTQVEMEYSDILDNSSITSRKESYTYADHAKYQAFNLENAYGIYMNALKDGDVKRQELAQELIGASAGNAAELTSKLLEIVESFKYDDGTIIDGYEDIYNEYMGMIYNLQSLTNPDTFLDIAKSITIGTGVDYEKAISDAYALVYSGNFSGVSDLDQDFVKALTDAGIDERTIEYIFELKEREYQSILDSINQKYNPENVSVPNYLYDVDYVKTPEDIQQEKLDRQNYEKKKEEVQAINDSLTKYAKENPIEFQLIYSYDEGFALLNKYIGEEKTKAVNNTDYVGDYVINAIRRVYDEAEAEAKVKSERGISFSDIFSLKNAENNLTPLGKINEELDKFQSVYKGLKEAMDSYNETGTFTLDQVQEIVSYGGDYLKYLMDENGNLQLNEEALNKVAIARINEMRVKALSNLMDKLDNITNEKQALDYLETQLLNTATAYDALTASRIKAWSENALANGISQETINKVTKSFENQVSAINEMFNSISIDSIYKSPSSSATKDAEQATKDYIDSYMNYMEKSLESGRIDYQTYSRDVAKFLKDMYDQGKIAAKDYHDYTKEMLTIQKSIYDKAISGIVYILDQEIDRLDEEKELIESNYQAKIDAIQSEIDALNEANEARKEQIELEKAQYELEKAQNQRVNKVYDGEQFVYTADSSAIRDAEDEVAQRKNDMKISQLESQIKSLEEAMESETKAIDDQIAKYEEYKKQIQDVANAYENAENVKYALAVTGLNSEAEILQCRVDVLNDFKDEYISIQQAIVEAAWASANEQVKAAQDASGKLKTIQGNNEGYKAYIGDELIGTYSTKQLAEFAAKNEVERRAENEAKKAAEKNGGRNASYIYELTKNGIGSQLIKKIRVEEYASGTKNAKPGWHKVSEKEYGDEIILTNDGNAVIAKGEQLYPFEGGEPVIKASETKKILDNIGNLEPIETNDLWKKLSGNMSDLSSMVKVDVPNYSKLNNMIIKNIIQQPSIVIGDIHLHEVQNVPDFAKALQKYLPNISVQYNGKH